MRERWTGEQPNPPIREKLPGTTKKQREWIVRAWQRVYGIDGKVCGFPVIRNERFYLHGKVAKVQVHHIVPRGWASFVLGWTEQQINSPLNLIPLCEKHHIARGVRGLDYLNEVVPAIHPDMEIARRGYTGKEHPTSYDFAFENRAKMMERREPYWNTDWDNALRDKAEETYYRYLQWQLENFGQYRDRWPERKRRT